MKGRIMGEPGVLTVPAEARDGDVAAGAPAGPDAVFEFAADGTVTCWSREAAGLFDVGERGAFGVRLDGLLYGPGLGVAIRQAADAACAAGGGRLPAGVTCAAVARRRGRPGLPVTVTVVAGAGGRAGTFVALVRRAGRDGAGGGEAARMAAIASAIPDALISIDLAGRVTGWNPGAEQTFGYRRDEILGRSAQILVPDGCEIGPDHLVREALARRPVRLVHAVRRHKDGRLLDVSVTAAPELDADGAVTQVAVLARDMTDLKAAERRIRATADELGRRVGALEALSTPAGTGPSVRPAAAAPPRRDVGDQTAASRATARQLTDAVAALGAQIERLRHFALHDPLTGLANRTALIEQLHAVPDGPHTMPRQLVIVDLDNFSHVNDLLGHDSGDELLRAVAARLTETAPPGSIIARLGADQYAILIADGTDQDVDAVAGRIARRVGEPLRLTGGRFDPAVSIGIAPLPADGPDPHGTAMRRADLALAEAKRAGGAAWRRFRPAMEHTAATDLQLRRELPGALGRGEFHLVYQPITDTRTGRVHGVEALLRWNHHRLGPIPPSQFVPVAERAGSILPIGRWVLARAVRDCAGLVADGLDVAVSVNVSPRQLAEPGLAEAITETLGDHDLPAHRLTVEITESQIAADDDAAGRLREIAAAGARLAVDDFGTGTSSLARLRDMPFTDLKIDKSFIDTITKPGGSRAIVNAIITLSHELGLGVTAEGVETQQQLATLAALGCDRIQGYLRAKPMTMPDLRTYLDGLATGASER